VSRESVYDPPATAQPAAEHGDVRPAAAAIGRPAGPAAAVVLAAGFASFALGLLSVLTAASTTVSEALTLSDRVGDLSGLTTAAAAVFFAAWVVLAIAWRRSDPPLPRVAAAAAVLVSLGLLGTFPPFFRLIGG
jgi:Mn2+/Fe2+ NRAMP family transporter